MKFKLYWTETGDEFEATAIDDELTAWFIDQCPGQFKVVNDPSTTAAKTIIADVQRVNQALAKLHLPPIVPPTNTLDQGELNRVHKQWVGIHRTHPNLDTLLYKIDPTLFDSFHSTNNKVHEIERSFNYALRTTDFKKHLNPFKEQEFHPGVFNISLIYSDFGRNSWEKFVNGDNTPNDAELSQWEYIGEYVNIELVRPYTITWPVKFTNWCQQHSIKPVFNKLPLGNIEESQLTHAREVMERNFLRLNNYLHITTA
jgi:hypothetical protein